MPSMKTKNNKKLPICPHCTGWMLAHDRLLNWLKCVSCGFCRRENE